MCFWRIDMAQEVQTLSDEIALTLLHDEALDFEHH